MGWGKGRMRQQESSTEPSLLRLRFHETKDWAAQPAQGIPTASQLLPAIRYVSMTACGVALPDIQELILLKKTFFTSYSILFFFFFNWSQFPPLVSAVASQNSCTGTKGWAQMGNGV